MYSVVREIGRPSAETIAALGVFPTAILSDALGRVGTMDTAIKPVTDGMTLAGPAVTVKVFPGDNLMCHLALKIARPGDVLVIDAEGLTGTAILGELMARCARRQGLAGIIIDGAVRDRAALRQMRWPVFARAAVPRGPLKNDPGAVNVPIACAGLVVQPGDVIVGDDDGVVVVPREEARSVMDAAMAITNKEAALRERVEAGEVLWDLLGLEKALAEYSVDWR